MKSKFAFLLALVIAAAPFSAARAQYYSVSGNTIGVNATLSGTCVSSSTPWIKVLSQNTAGGSYATGQTIPVKWETCNIPQTALMTVDIINVNGLNYPSSTDSNDYPGYKIVSNSGQDTYTIPTQGSLQGNSYPIFPAHLNQAVYKVRVDSKIPSLSSNIMALSDATFGITKPVVSGTTLPVATVISTAACSSTTAPWIKVLSPNGGEGFAVGSTMHIQWASCNISSGAAVNLQLLKQTTGPSLNIPAYYGQALISLAVPNTGAYNWVIPHSIPSGTMYLVSIDGSMRGQEGSGFRDISDNTFSVNTGILSSTAVSPAALMSPIASGCVAGALFNSMTGARCMPIASTAGAVAPVAAPSLAVRNTANPTTTLAVNPKVSVQNQNGDMYVRYIASNVSPAVLTSSAAIQGNGSFKVAAGATETFTWTSGAQTAKFAVYNQGNETISVAGVIPTGMLFTSTATTVGNATFKIMNGTTETVTANALFTVSNNPSQSTQRVLSQDLAVGSRGDAVKDLQQILVDAGLLSADNATGYFGNVTAQAVKNFQIRKGLPAVGTVGPMTRAVLNANITATPIVSATPAPQIAPLATAGTGVASKACLVYAYGVSNLVGNIVPGAVNQPLMSILVGNQVPNAVVSVPNLSVSIDTNIATTLSNVHFTDVNGNPLGTATISQIMLPNTTTYTFANLGTIHQTSEGTGYIQLRADVANTPIPSTSYSNIKVDNAQTPGSCFFPRTLSKSWFNKG